MHIDSGMDKSTDPEPGVDMNPAPDPDPNLYINQHVYRCRIPDATESDRARSRY